MASAPTNRSADQAVFNTGELLEIILLHLPTKTLLLSQRVCGTWRQAIQNSRLLRQALFLEPIATLDIYYRATTKVGRTCPRGLLYTPRPTTSTPPGEGWYDKATNQRVEHLFTNPLFKGSIGLLSLAERRRAKKDRGYEASQKPFVPVCYEAWDRPEASFRNMYLSQPALCAVKTEAVTFPGIGNFTSRSETHRRGKGVTAGDIFDDLKARYIYVGYDRSAATIFERPEGSSDGEWLDNWERLEGNGMLDILRAKPLR